MNSHGKSHVFRPKSHMKSPCSSVFFGNVLQSWLQGIDLSNASERVKEVCYKAMENQHGQTPEIIELNRPWLPKQTVKLPEEYWTKHCPSGHTLHRRSLIPRSIGIRGVFNYQIYPCNMSPKTLKGFIIIPGLVVALDPRCVPLYLADFMPSPWNFGWISPNRRWI